VSWGLLAPRFSATASASLVDMTRTVDQGMWVVASQTETKAVGTRHCYLGQVIQRVEERMLGQLVLCSRRDVVFVLAAGSNSAAGRQRAVVRSILVGL
jgi:hypothetical protein